MLLPMWSLDQSLRGRVLAWKMGGVEGDTSIGFGNDLLNHLLMTQKLDPDYGCNVMRSSGYKRRIF